MAQKSLILISLWSFCLAEFAFNQIEALTNCSSDYCGLHGVCNKYTDNPVCLCKDGFVGIKCSFSDPCFTLKPCSTNGACFPLIKLNGTIETVSYHCQCYSGFSGPDCRNGSIVMIFWLIY
jgi:hypothetical protein